MNMDDRLMTVKELAEYLQVSDETVYRWSSQGRIPRIKLGGNLVRFRMREVGGWLQTMERKGKPTKRVEI